MDVDTKILRLHHALNVLPHNLVKYEASFDLQWKMARFM